MTMLRLKLLPGLLVRKDQPIEGALVTIMGASLTIEPDHAPISPQGSPAAKTPPPNPPGTGTEEDKDS